MRRPLFYPRGVAFSPCLKDHPFVKGLPCLVVSLFSQIVIFDTHVLFGPFSNPKVVRVVAFLQAPKGLNNLHVCFEEAKTF